ncbi:hypothetical protein J437_LFUL017469 [Ladona fulva]|uniref:Uncharacterized protein n=1 Tax=Ladona fulva TaxID=123851 RepID=A0A8K0P3Z6_LADFU|nr:hypothetical protein J437_LFUL017469 [Ladona fulva]
MQTTSERRKCAVVSSLNISLNLTSDPDVGFSSCINPYLAQLFDITQFDFASTLLTCGKKEPLTLPSFTNSGMFPDPGSRKLKQSQPGTRIEYKEYYYGSGGGERPQHGGGMYGAGSWGTGGFGSGGYGSGNYGAPWSPHGGAQVEGSRGPSGPPSWGGGGPGGGGGSWSGGTSGGGGSWGGKPGGPGSNWNQDSTSYLFDRNSSATAIVGSGVRVDAVRGGAIVVTTDGKG